LATLSLTARGTQGIETETETIICVKKNAINPVEPMFWIAFTNRLKIYFSAAEKSNVC
jgi:hypothetical protein